MPFNADLAQKIADSKDRDIATFFAGRKAEITAFHQALRQASDSTAAIFRIFQGPPGSGKTSLAHHLEEGGEQLLWVRPEGGDMLDRESFQNAILHAALKRKNSREAGATTLDFIAAIAKRPEVGDMATEALAQFAERNATLVVHIDEAHSMSSKFNERLKSLHTIGCGRPCIVLFTGLEHTQSRITSIPGLSRLSYESVWPMGSLSDEDCCESTMKMLTALLGGGAANGGKEIAEMAGKLSKGWPAHLHSAQKAICEELILTDGDRINYPAVKKRSTDLRYRYYDRRMDFPPFDRRPNLGHKVAAALGKAAPCEFDEMANMLEKKLGAHLLNIKVTANDLMDRIYEKGILTQTERGFQIAIPSMGEWAQSRRRDSDHGH